MKRFLSLFLLALISAGSILAQTFSTVTGVWERGKPNTVKMFKIVNGGLSEVASCALADNGSFNMSFAPKEEGFYVLGLEATSPLNRYMFYLKPGDPLQVNVNATSYQLAGKNNTLENQEMARWHDFIFPLEDNAFYFKGKRTTYVEFFPMMEEKLAALKTYKVGKTKNKTFEAAFADYRQFDLLSCALQFVYTPRSAHPQDEDFIDYYRQIDVPALSRNNAALHYPNGLHTLVNAYMTGIKLSTTLSAEEKQKRQRNYSSSLLSDLDNGVINNETIKGEIVLMFGQSNKTMAGLEQYQKDYGKYLITDSQKKRFEQIRERIKLSTIETEPIDFKFADVNGKEVALSDFRGKIVYVDIWATWCGPCKGELPFMKTLEAEYKNNKDIVFMGISVDASKDIQKWKNFLEKEQLPGVQLFAGDSAGETLTKPFKIKGIPRFMLVGRDGKLIYMDAVRPSSSEVRPMLDAALKK